jgi:hypothetical protein
MRTTTNTEGTFPGHDGIRSGSSSTPAAGFALVVTLALMALLTVATLSLLALSSAAVRGSGHGAAQAKAQANARLALIIALGELQKEMGPDMRVSAEAAVFDANPRTEAIEGVEQSGWLASYHAWGDWLNAEYAPPGVSGRLPIASTYAPRREKMFRRWLLSLPQGKERDIKAPDSLAGWDRSNSVVLVGPGTLGPAAATHPDRVTRASLVAAGEGGRQAWWIGPENHKAKINPASGPRKMAAAEWESSQGDTSDSGVAALEGFESLAEDPALARRLVTTRTLGAAGIAPEKVQSHFNHLTAYSRGVLASVRTGHLKKDLSLLFENDNNRLPAPYRFNPGQDIREPSIRPMSPELAANNPTIPNRHFQSWTNMRHFYRMYRSTSDATVGEIGGPGILNWSGSQPWTSIVSSTSLGASNAWDGSNNYWRVPILAKITFIYSLLTEPSPSQPGKFDCYHVYSPVFTFWNPYNVELRIPDNKLDYLTSAYKVWPNSGSFWLGNTMVKDADQLGAFGQFGYSQGVVTRSYLRSGGSGEIVFKPGELRVFSLASRISNASEAGAADLVPGFNPWAIGGEKKLYGTYTPVENPGITVEFSHNYWGGNINFGNTCGSLAMVGWWDRRSNSNPGALPINYAIDWLQKRDRRAPITPPGTGYIARWVFDSQPNPVAFCQLVVKGLSEFNYESIPWEQDWRCRNWLHAPPFYFGSGMYISENDAIAHTQRLDCPYVVFFGPTSMAEMPNVVAHLGSSAFLGSGSDPFEKVTSVAALELPTAPVSSLAGFAGMRINPGWLRANQLGSHLSVNTYSGNAVLSTGEESLHAAETKRVAYQSGVTGPGIGNSFIHPMLAREGVYRYLDNSKSQDIPNREQPDSTNENDTKAYNDYWDHVFLLNDALWDDYFVSSLADQVRPGAGAAASLSANLDRLAEGRELANSRYRLHAAGVAAAKIKQELQAADGYLKAARHLMVDGMFNVNSTSVEAWHALFAGIRERKLVYREAAGGLRAIQPPAGKIAVARFNTEVSDQEMEDPATGAAMPDGAPGWAGVRYLDDRQLRKLAEQCVRQVKLRGPFLNFSEFINRRLSNDELGLMGALQSAIDYDDAGPDPASINYRFKNGPDFMMKSSALGQHSFATPEAAEGSRFAGIPGYVIQSDLLKPVANTLAVRDDTFRIRAYGETRDASGRVIASAWCEAIVQRLPEYWDEANDPTVPARLISDDGRFGDNDELTPTNRRFGRKFQIMGFRWLAEPEV